MVYRARSPLPLLEMNRQIVVCVAVYIGPRGIIQSFGYVVASRGAAVQMRSQLARGSNLRRKLGSLVRDEIGVEPTRGVLPVFLVATLNAHSSQCASDPIRGYRHISSTSIYVLYKPACTVSKRQQPSSSSQYRTRSSRSKSILGPTTPTLSYC